MMSKSAIVKQMAIKPRIVMDLKSSDLNRAMKVIVYREGMNSMKELMLLSVAKQYPELASYIKHELS